MYFLFLLLFSGIMTATAQTTVLSNAVDSTKVNTLRLVVDADGFFKDNEYEGEVVRGYTLPGFWVRPRVTYSPSPKLNFELGLHAIVYNGAGKYPNYAFHDIVRWKGNQYSNGAHLMPWFRAEAHLGCLDLTIGSLHRDDNQHNVILPLFNPETEFSTDPEQGVEVRIHKNRYTLDAWVDWESFIYQMDTHQEAFTVGIVQEVELTNPSNKRWHLSVPIQFLAQHRGGELDKTDMGVQTLYNAAIGLKAFMPFHTKALNSLQAEVLYLHTMQQAGGLLPFRNGSGVWGSVKARFWKHLNGQLGIFHANNFMSLHGSPFFGTVSVKDASGRYDGMTTGYYGAEYRYPIGFGCSVAAFVNGYLNSSNRYTHTNPESGATEVSNPGMVHSFDFGVCLRANLDFKLKSFAKK